MKQYIIAIGNFFFRWRDTAFTLIFLVGLAILGTPRPGYWITGWYGAIQQDEFLSILGALLVFAGISVRALVIGFIYVKRAGEGKKIHAEELYQHGLFAHTRNPLYVGNLLVVTGAIATLNLTLFWFPVLPFFYFVYYSIILAEESFLGHKFGKEYQAYLQNVNRLFPGDILSIRESFRGMTFMFRRVVKVEHGSTSLILISLLLANLVKFRYRYGIPFGDFREIVFFVLLGIVLVYLIAAALLKKTGKLEWQQA